METGLKNISKTVTPLRSVVCVDGITVTGSSKAECVEDYVQKVIRRFELDITENNAEIAKAQRKIAVLMKEIEERKENIRTAKNLITDFDLWLDWEKYPPEESYKIITRAPYPPF